MKKSIFFSVALLFAVQSLLSQTYHNDDKEGLRIFLRQPSATSGMLNAEQIGLSISDTSTWYANENWVAKIPTTFLIWNNDNPKRLDTIKFRYPATFAGVLDGGKWDKLTYLNCTHNQLISIDVSGCLNLIFFDGSYNSLLSSLDVSNCSNLESLSCSNNQLSSLDVSNCPNLINFSCNYNQLSSLDVSKCPKLELLSCYNNQLTSLDVSKCPKLESLSCSDNQLSSLDVSKCPNLELCNFSNNQLTHLNINGCLNLKGLYCHTNQLQNTLDVSNRQELSILSCHTNQLTGVNVSDCPNISNFSCHTNQISELDLSDCSNIKFLPCHTNQLRSLDVSGFQKLMDLYCQNNQLTHLNVSNCPNLEYLSCYNNRLQLLDLYAANQAIQYQSNREFGTQNLLPKRVLLDVPLFPDQSFIIINDTLYTEYSVTQNDSLTPASSYTVTNGVLTLHDTGIYTVTMSNIAIFSSYSYPAEVIVELHAIEAYNTDACLSDITVSAGILSPAFSCTTFDYTVDVANSVDTINIIAMLNDLYATVHGDTGLQQLVVGDNHFNIIVIAEDGIATQQYTVMVNRSSVGIIELHPATSLRIYPNPTTGELRFTNEEELRIENIEIFDITGKLIKTYFPASSTINISQLLSGIYFISFYYEGQKITRKFVKQ